MITRGKRREALKKALKLSQNGEVTYVLTGNDNIVITQDKDEATTYIRTNGYRLYTKCKDFRVDFCNQEGETT